MAYVRSQGITPTERLLGKLCDRAFLKLWSYPSVYRNQFAGGQNKGQRKELCDLLVVFGNRVIVFSDKHCSIPDTGNLSLDWSRWFKRAIAKSADQLYGAERWLRDAQSRLFTDRACQVPFPIALPDAQYMRINLVVVAHGAAERCKQHFGDPIGSLIIDTGLRSAVHNEPFTVGLLDEAKTLVHVFDESSIKLVIDNLDTVTDFTDYLDRREALFKRHSRIVATGEEQLLAAYLRELNSVKQHDFVFPADADFIFLDESHWQHYADHEQRRAKINANKQSYSWDELIEKFSYHVFRGTQRTATSRDLNEQSKLLYWLAREPRVRRRMLASALLGLLKTSTEHRNKEGIISRFTRLVEPSYEGDPYFLFLTLSRSSMSDDKYRDVRLEVLKAYCQVVKLRYPNAKDVVGIAVESSLYGEMTEDAIYLDVREWTPEMAEQAREFQQELQMLNHVSVKRGREQEYPTHGREISRNLSKFGAVSRNAKCPCGSKIKYRKCHGKEYFENKRSQRK